MHYSYKPEECLTKGTKDHSCSAKLHCPTWQPLPHAAGLNWDVLGMLDLEEKQSILEIFHTTYKLRWSFGHLEVILPSFYFIT